MKWGIRHSLGTVNCKEAKIEKTSGDVQYIAKRTDTGVQVWMGVGSGGENHGVYSTTLGKWMIYGNKTTVHLNGTAENSVKWNGLTDDHTTENTSDTWVLVSKGDKIQHRVLKASLNNRGVRTASAKTHTNFGTNNTDLADMSVLAYWNGAYNSGNSSNLTYAHQGTIQCKPTVLYNNGTGTTGTVTLSQTAANFTYLKIYYCDNDSIYNCTNIVSPNGKRAYLLSGYPLTSSNQNMNFKHKVVTISGTSISRFGSETAIIQNGVHPQVINENLTKIVRVEGWK